MKTPALIPPQISATAALLVVEKQERRGEVEDLLLYWEAWAPILSFHGVGVKKVILTVRRPCTCGNS